MIRRFLPVQDTFIFGTVSGSTASTGSEGDLRNAGKDEILELGRCSYSDIFDTYAARILVKFDTLTLSASIAGVKNYVAKLHYYLADSEGLPESYIVDCYNLAEPWVEGTDRSYDVTKDPTGATWKYRIPTTKTPWSIPGADIKFFLNGGYASRSGYLTLYNGGEAIDMPFTSVVDGGKADSDFSLENLYRESGIERVLSSTYYGKCPNRQDLELDVTDMVPGWLVHNEGAVIALREEEQLVDRGACLKYYSSDTHTIYKPYLEICYDDSEYDSALETISTLDFKVAVSDFRSEYRYGDFIRMNLQVNPLYPNRIFSTSSIYKVNNVLPETAYWGIRNEYTNEMVVDFSKYTKISADDNGSFFNLDTTLLEPERFYRLLVQVKFDRNKITIDNRNIFKVVRDGKY